MSFFSSIKGLLGRKNTAEAQEASARPALSPAGNSAPDESPGESLLLEALRAAPPKLSAWLDILLAEVRQAGPLLEARLLLLFRALETPADEAGRFIAAFSRWLADMGYTRLEEFRSELQYRLALALDMEDEEDEKSRLLLKLGQGLSKSRAHFGRGLQSLFLAGRGLDEGFWEEMEEALILGDVGFDAAVELTRRLRLRASHEGVTAPPALRLLLREEIAAVFQTERRILALTPPEIILFAGVNGAGKTTTIAKLAHRYILQGKKTLLAAADTFRAAAIEQLEVWAARSGADFYARAQGSDPASVAYAAAEKAVREGYAALMVDTAGRLQSKSNLMEELAKIRRALGKARLGAPQRSVLVLDANTGQNALSQVKLFTEAGGVDEIMLSKLDGTAKGGMAVAIAMTHKLPISHIGLGEKMEDLRPFDAAAFAAALVGE